MSSRPHTALHVILCLALAGLNAARAETWEANLTAAHTGGGSHRGTLYPSSSELRLAWSAPPSLRVHHYTLRAVESRSTVQAWAPAEGDASRPGFRPRRSSLVIRGLKSATSYQLLIRACRNASCDSFLDGDRAATATTPAEYWRVIGTGASYASAARVVPDGNVGSHAMRYGPWAGPEKDGSIQLYYTPLQREEKGVKIGQQLNGSPLAFEGISGFGLMRACGELPMGPNAPPVPAECQNPNGIATGVNLFQAIPLAPAEGETVGKVRLFFEAPGQGGRQRIVYLDSQDGFVGRDFHRGAATRCDSALDYSPGGACEPTLVVGVDIDAPADRNPNLLNARQFKIAWPTAVSTAWDQAPGALMWFTTEWRDRRCSNFDFNAAYAVWDGRKWQVQYGQDGCPKILAGVQAPAPVQVGSPSAVARYKLYFSRHRTPGGPTDPRVAIKPFQVLYADPEWTGDEQLTGFDDWEPLDSARDVHFLWPDGTELTEDQESRLDDFFVFAPGSDPSRLIMFSDMSATGLNAIPFLGAAILINP